MIQAKQELLAALAAAVAQVAPRPATDDAASARLPAHLSTNLSRYAPTFERPKQAAHGDFAITAAMALAKALKRNPRELAAALVSALQAQPAVQRWVSALEIAGPGFINLRLNPAARQAVVAEVLAAGDQFGQRAPTGAKVMVEFVSANPTGPLHVGHGRNAALGDSICNLLASQGAQVLREFYYNDAGVQIQTLALSVQCRVRGLAPGMPGWPENAYNGEYIADIAADFCAGKTVHADDREFTASGRPDDLAGMAQFAVAYLRHEQDLDLRAFGVRFDHHFLESSLYREGRVDDTVQRLIASGKTYELDGALWLRSTDYGDDKDRVMRKSAPAGADLAARDASYTYFVPDVAYHIDKWQRGYARAIVVVGSDHHGTIARVRAGLQAVGLGIAPGYPDYVLYKMITVVRGGQEVKISKRAGSYVTLRDLIEWTSRDAVRFFLVSRKADTEFVFDIDLALKANDENPVFYVQYAHARICSVLAQYLAKTAAKTAAKIAVKPATKTGTAPNWAQADLSMLTAPTEAALMSTLAAYPEVLSEAAADMAPHAVAFYLRDLASALHSWYGAERLLADDPALAAARMALLATTRQVLRNALAMIGVGAPEQMAREPLPDLAPPSPPSPSTPANPAAEVAA